MAPRFIIVLYNHVPCVIWYDPQGAEEEWQKVFYIGAAMYTAGWVMFMVFADAEVQSWSELEKDAIVDTRFHTERVDSMTINDKVLGHKYSCKSISALLDAEEMAIALRKHRNSEIGRYFLGISRDVRITRNIPDKEALAALAIDATDVADKFSGGAIDVVDTMVNFGGVADVVDKVRNSRGAAVVIDKVIQVEPLNKPKLNGIMANKHISVMGIGNIISAKRHVYTLDAVYSTNLWRQLNILHLLFSI